MRGEVDNPEQDLKMDSMWGQRESKAVRMTLV